MMNPAAICSWPARRKWLAGSVACARAEKNREDRADGYVGVNVRRTIQRIDRNRERRVRMQAKRGRQFFGKHCCYWSIPQSFNEKVVRCNVQQFLCVSVAIGRAER